MATLRIKTSGGQHLLPHVDLQATLSTLKESIAALTGIPSYRLKLRQGFPPKVIDVRDESCSLGMLGIRSGDTLLADKLDSEVTKPAIASSVLNSTMDAFQQQALAAQGILTRKMVPANNSCLFTSIDLLMEQRSDVNLESAKPMRELIAMIVHSDGDTYNSAVLGKSNKEYCKWIKSKDSWGGAIEISILSKYYNMEIDVVDTQSGRIDRFGEDQNYTQRILVIYDGIHYDPLVLESLDPSRPTYKYIFATSNDSILLQAQELANEAKSSRQFTNVNQFALRCLVCQICLSGQVEAQAHAKNTGHINFGEV